MASSQRTHLHFLIGLVVSAAAIYLSLRKIDYQALYNALRSVNYFVLMPALVAQFSCFVLKGIGWRYLLVPAKKDVRATSTISVLVVGLMVNNLFPAKMGELARAYLIGERENLPKTLGLSTILIEHLLDILVLMIFLLVLLPSVPIPPWLRTGGALTGFLAVALIAAVFIVMRHEEKFLGWASKWLDRLPVRLRGKAQAILGSFLRGLRVVTGRYVFYTFAALLAMWCVVVLVAYLIMAAFGLFLPVQAAVMVVIFTAFGKIIPSSPGAVGTYHYLAIVVLTAFGVAKEIALGYAIVLHGFFFVVEVSVGILILVAGNLSFGRIVRGAESP